MRRILVMTTRGPVETDAASTPVPGLVAIRSTANDAVWLVTHERSGLSLDVGCPSAEAAAGIAQHLTSVTDWTRSAAELDRDDTLSRAYRILDALVRQHGLERVTLCESASRGDINVLA